MNYTITSTRSKREPLVHKHGMTKVFVLSNKGEKYTICGLLIENSLYGRWEQTDKEVTCKKCLKSFQQGY